ncbi:MAG: site-specific integrase [Candidatus Cloacimonetes bacterium]|nr:site-specific integrase [Candidatus Cloacimonadota bacterium]MBL7149012.1 site-specific integrase [Candidatus Cloacimonadota bacterium]
MLIKTGICTIRNERRIALLFDYNEDVITLVKQIKGRKWSASNKFWHIPYQANYLKELNEKFHGKLEFIENTSESKIEKKIKLPAEYIETLKLKNYSEPTIKTYRLHFQQLLRYFKNTKPEEITFDEIRQYILFLVEEKKYSTSSQNNAINAIKFYYNEVINRTIDDFFIPRPRKAKTIPKILNEQEVSKILKNINNLRDKCMIFLIYSAGLSPSEITYLKIKDIDSNKMKIFVSSAKGEKDRFVILSEKILNLLREYFKKYKPQEWLFENKPGMQYSKRNIQKAFKTAVDKSGITKPATLSILKNSFAVHLLEKGVDVRYIQQMLGHKHSKTTMKYLRVSKRDLSAIQSPLDSLDV